MRFVKIRARFLQIKLVSKPQTPNVTHSFWDLNFFMSSSIKFCMKHIFRVIWQSYECLFSENCKKKNCSRKIQIGGILGIYFSGKPPEISRFVTSPLIPKKTSFHPWKFCKNVWHPWKFKVKNQEPWKFKMSFSILNTPGNYTPFLVVPKISACSFFNIPGNSMYATPLIPATPPPFFPVLIFLGDSPIFFLILAPFQVCKFPLSLVWKNTFLEHYNTRVQSTTQYLWPKIKKWAHSEVLSIRCTY